MRTKIWLVLLCGTLLGGAACRKSESEEKRDVIEAQQKVAEEKRDVVEAQRDVGAERTAYRDRLKARLAEIDAKLDELAAKTDEKSKETSAKLRVRRDELNVKLDRLGDKSAATWDEFKKDADSAFESLEKDIRDAF